MIGLFWLENRRSLTTLTQPGTSNFLDSSHKESGTDRKLDVDRLDGWIDGWLGELYQ